MRRTFGIILVALLSSGFGSCGVTYIYLPFEKKECSPEFSFPDQVSFSALELKDFFSDLPYKDGLLIQKVDCKDATAIEGKDPLIGKLSYAACYEQIAENKSKNETGKILFKFYWYETSTGEKKLVASQSAVGPGHTDLLRVAQRFNESLKRNTKGTNFNSCYIPIGQPKFMDQNSIDELEKK